MADLEIVDALARLQLAASRCGYRVDLVCAPTEVLELIELAGLSDVLGGFGETALVPPGRAGRPDAASSVAPIVLTIGAPCVLSSERPSHPGDEDRSPEPS
jgi:hypothetical protein